MHPDIFLYHADCRAALRALPDNSIDSVVTDPPYALVSVVKRFGSPNAAPAKGNDAYMRASAGFMGKTWDTGEVAFSEEFWREVWRVIKPGAHVVAFGASRGYHRMACAIEDAGFEIRDSLMWIYGTGFPKSQNVAKFIDKELGVDGEIFATGDAVKRMIPGAEQNENGWIKNDGREFVPHEYLPASLQAQEFNGFGTALKPAFEPIVLARKPLSESTVAANVLRWRTGALNIDACRIEAAQGDAPVSWTAPRGGIWRTDAAAKAELVTTGQGRWPANVIHDGSDEVVGTFPTTKSGVLKAGTVRNSENKIYGKGMAAAGKPATTYDTGGDSGSAARFFYSAKASKADRAGSKHPTVKPVALMQWLCRLVTPPGGVVLDPFAGSGTTGAAAVAEGFKAVLCEREDEYAADIRRRLAVPGTIMSPPSLSGHCDERRVKGGQLDQSA